MIAILLLPLFLFCHIWVTIWLLRWLETLGAFFENRIVKAIVASIYLILFFCMYIAAILPHGTLEKGMHIVGYYWYGASIYIFIVVFAAILARFIIRHSGFKDRAWVSGRKTLRIVGMLCVVVIAATAIGGHFNAMNLQTTRYDVKIDKVSKLKDLNVVLVADQHLGYSVGPEMMEQMVEKINACEPDLVLFGGDIFDNCYEIVPEPEKTEKILRGIRSRYGVYAVLGNHDCEEPVIAGFTFKSDEEKGASDGMYEFIEKSNIRLLCDEAVLIDDSFYLYGRPDEERLGRDVAGSRLTPDELMAKMDEDKPVIVLEHEPKELDELDAAGVDLHMAGHTHAGQLFPLTVSVALMWDNSYGLLEKSHMTSIVTSGVGIFGPYIRVGTKPEVCDIHVTFD